MQNNLNGPQNRQRKKVYIPDGVRPQPRFLFLFFKFFFTDFFLNWPRFKKEPIVINPNEIKVWMIGHATTLINFYGTTIFTDPIFYHLTLTRRLMRIGYKISDLPKIDYVLLSHAHMDHFNIPSLKKLANPDITLILSENCLDLVNRMNYKEIIPMHYGDKLNIDGLEIVAHQSMHWGERYPWQKKGRGYNYYLLKKAGRTILFGGDSGYIPDFFKELKKENTDLVLLPIGAYYPWNDYNKVHMNPEEAVQAFQEINAKYFIPIHWGSFRLSYEPMNEPPQLLLKLATKNRITEQVKILYNGQSFVLPK